MCGGSIIRDNYVLTAGHCVDYLQNGFVRAGSNYTYVGGTIHHIVEIKRHESYAESFKAIINDVALLRVEPPFIYNARVAPVTFSDRSRQSLKEGDQISVTGYGRLRENGELAKNLMGVSAPIVSNEKCSTDYTHVGFGKILEDRFCAGYTEGGRDSCQGDSGGPVMIDGRQLGVVSYGYGCARPNLPGIYAYVPYFADWIEKNIIVEEESELNEV